jgi:predicted NAD-dependent protein-ADP-ribosyltransferase YbiA (DUF1768 family)
MGKQQFKTTVHAMSWMKLHTLGEQELADRVQACQTHHEVIHLASDESIVAAVMEREGKLHVTATTNSSPASMEMPPPAPRAPATTLASSTQTATTTATPPAKKTDLLFVHADHHAIDIRRRIRTVDQVRADLFALVREWWTPRESDVYLSVLRLKFEQHMDLADLLRSTGDMELIAAPGAGTSANSVSTGGGTKRKAASSDSNTLGQLLMKVRSELAPPVPRTVPPGAPF